MVGWVDLIPTLIDLAGGQVPDGLDGQTFAPVLLGSADAHRQMIFTTHTGNGPMNVFSMRGVRHGRFKLIRNLRSDAYHTTHANHLRRDGAGAYWDSWDEVAKSDPNAAEIGRRYYTRDEIELFDLEADPKELNNVASYSSHATTLNELRGYLSDWTSAQGDDVQPHRDP